MSGEAQALRDALGTGTGLVIAGQSVAVREVRLEELPRVIELFTPAVQEAFERGLDLGAWFQKSGLLKPGERIRLDQEHIVQLGLRAFPLLAVLPAGIRALIELCVMCTDRPADEIRKLGLDEATRLATAVIEANADFFFWRLWPAIQAAMSQLIGRFAAAREKKRPPTPAAGPKPSSA